MANTYTLMALCEQLVDKATKMRSEKARVDIRRRDRVTGDVSDSLMQSALAMGVTGLSYKRLIKMSGGDPADADKDGDPKKGSELCSIHCISITTARQPVSIYPVLFIL